MESLIILVGNHGESLGEHGEAGHGYFTYQSTLHVPLIIKLPGNFRAKTISQQVATIDILPTIFSLTGIQVPQEIDGHDLSPYLFNKKYAKKPSYLYIESITPSKYGCPPIEGVITYPWKLIQSPEPELYNLKEDPGEKNNLYTRNLVKKNEITKLLDRLKKRHARKNRTQSSQDNKKMDHLRSLGYFGGGTRKSGTTDKDQKKLIKTHTILEKAKYSLFNNKRSEAKKFYLEVLNNSPKNLEALEGIKIAEKKK